MLITDLSAGQLLLLALPVLPNLWALHHAFSHDFADPREKTRWMQACIFIPCVAGLAYIAVGRRHAMKLTAGTPQQAAMAAEGRESRDIPSADAEKRADAFPPAHCRPDGWSFGCPDEKKEGNQS